MHAALRFGAFALVVAFVGGTAGCVGQDTSALGQIKPGETVFADLWNEDNETGDEALVEQKPSGLWVIDTSSACPFPSQHTNIVAEQPSGAAF